MPAASAVTDPGLNEFEVGGRWFGCAPRVDPTVLVGVMRRTQRAPTDVTDPGFHDWMSTVVGFLILATDEADHDALIATLTSQAASDPEATALAVAEIFAGLLALYTDHEVDEIQRFIVSQEEARTGEHPFPPAPIRRRQTVDDLNRIQARHGHKATGEVLNPGV
jgi:hypothetical protein